VIAVYIIKCIYFDIYNVDFRRILRADEYSGLERNDPFLSMGVIFQDFF